MSDEPDSLILRMLREMRAKMADIRDTVATKSDLADLKSEVTSVKAELKSDIRSLRADVASDLLVARKETTEQIAGLRRAVMESHSPVADHGILISDREAGVRRVEQHLNLPPLETH
jgi:cell division septum initiation protein DivIVA